MDEKQQTEISPPPNTVSPPPTSLSNTQNYTDQDYPYPSKHLPFCIDNPEYLHRHRFIVPPEEAYYFYPSGEDVFIPFPKKPEKALRRVHYGVTLTPYEKDGILKFKKLMDKETYAASYPTFSEPDYVRFNYSVQYDIEKAYKEFKEHIEWRKKTFPMNITPKSKEFEILNSGFSYIYGRDHCFRPLIVFQPSVYIKNAKKYTFNEWCNACVYICEYVERNMLIKGQVENWIMLTDLKGASLFSLAGEVKKVMNVMSSSYRGRLHLNYIFNLSGLLTILFKMVKAFLDEITVKKLIVVNDNTELQNQIRPDNLEKKFGGTNDDLIPEGDNLFPPKYEGKKYRFDNDTQLISKEEYLKRLADDKVIEISPYIKREQDLKAAQEKTNDKHIRDKSLEKLKEKHRLLEEQREREKKKREELNKQELIKRNSIAIAMKKEKDFLQGYEWKVENEIKEGECFSKYRNNNSSSVVRRNSRVKKKTSNNNTRTIELFQNKRRTMETLAHIDL